MTLENDIKKKIRKHGNRCLDPQSCCANYELNETLSLIKKARAELNCSNKFNIEELAIMLHYWYLQATKKLNPKSFNKKAQVDYSKLTEEQKFIDRYISKKITDAFMIKLDSKLGFGKANEVKPDTLQRANVYKRTPSPEKPKEVKQCAKHSAS